MASHLVNTNLCTHKHTNTDTRTHTTRHSLTHWRSPLLQFTHCTHTDAQTHWHSHTRQVTSHKLDSAAEEKRHAPSQPHAGGWGHWDDFLVCWDLLVGSWSFGSFQQFEAQSTTLPKHKWERFRQLELVHPDGWSPRLVSNIFDVLTCSKLIRPKARANASSEVWQTRASSLPASKVAVQKSNLALQATASVFVFAAGESVSQVEWPMQICSGFHCQQWVRSRLESFLSQPDQNSWSSWSKHLTEASWVELVPNDSALKWALPKSKTSWRQSKARQWPQKSSQRCRSDVNIEVDILQQAQQRGTQTSSFCWDSRWSFWMTTWAGSRFHSTTSAGEWMSCALTAVTLGNCCTWFAVFFSALLTTSLINMCSSFNKKSPLWNESVIFSNAVLWNESVQEVQFPLILDLTTSFLFLFVFLRCVCCFYFDLFPGLFAFLEVMTSKIKQNVSIYLHPIAVLLLAQGGIWCLGHPLLVAWPFLRGWAGGASQVLAAPLLRVAWVLVWRLLARGAGSALLMTGGFGVIRRDTSRLAMASLEDDLSDLLWHSPQADHVALRLGGFAVEDEDLVLSSCAGVGDASLAQYFRCRASPPFL